MAVGMQNCIKAYLFHSDTQNASASVTRATEVSSGLITMAGYCTFVTQTTQLAQELERSCARISLKKV